MSTNFDWIYQTVEFKKLKEYTRIKAGDNLSFEEAMPIALWSWIDNPWHKVYNLKNDVRYTSSFGDLVVQRVRDALLNNPMTIEELRKIANEDAKKFKKIPGIGPAGAKFLSELFKED